MKSAHGQQTGNCNEKYKNYQKEKNLYRGSVLILLTDEPCLWCKMWTLNGAFAKMPACIFTKND